MLSDLNMPLGSLPLLSCIIMRRAEYDLLVRGSEAATLMSQLAGVQVVVRDTLADGLVYILEYTNGTKDLVRVDGQVTRIKAAPMFPIFGGPRC